jgi:hypothetical protein
MSLPAKYTVKWYDENNKNQCQFIICEDIYNLIKIECVETDNINYLQECNFEIENLIQNPNIMNK